MLRDAKSDRAKLAPRSPRQAHMLERCPEGPRSMMVSGFDRDLRQGNGALPLTSDLAQAKLLELATVSA